MSEDDPIVKILEENIKFHLKEMESTQDKIEKLEKEKKRILNGSE